jgi:hypothetical protein
MKNEKALHAAFLNENCTLPQRYPKSRSPRELAERHLRIAKWTQMPRGGHFAALEEPELLVEDMRAFFRSFRTTSVRQTA